MSNEAAIVVKKSASVKRGVKKQAIKLLTDCGCDWYGAAEAVVGLAHRKLEPPIPCQDAVVCMVGRRPFIVMADGAGSARLSHIGAHAVVTALRRFLLTMNSEYAAVLNSFKQPKLESVRRLALLPVHHAVGTLIDIATNYQRHVDDFRCTLTLLIGGSKYWLWVKIGDGYIVTESAGTLAAVGNADRGEFVNATQFVDGNLSPDNVGFGLIPAEGLTGVCAMTDGAAERLVSTEDGRISGQVNRFVEEARQQKISRATLFQFLSNAEVWASSSGDDKSLAILAKDVVRTTDNHGHLS